MLCRNRDPRQPSPLFKHHFNHPTASPPQIVPWLDFISSYTFPASLAPSRLAESVATVAILVPARFIDLKPRLALSISLVAFDGDLLPVAFDKIVSPVTNVQKLLPYWAEKKVQGKNYKVRLSTWPRLRLA